jgi:ATP-binding cassette subfamily B protein
MAHTNLRRDLGRCVPYLRPYARRIALVLALTVIASGLPALEPLGLRAIFDHLVDSPTARALVGPVLFLASLGVIRYALDRVSILVAWRVRLAVNRDLLAEATARLHVLPLSYHQGRGIGETMTRVDRGITSLMEGLAQLTFQAIPALIYVAVSSVIMLRLSWPLALLAACFVIPPLLIGGRTTTEIVERERAGLERWCRIYSRFQQVLAGIKVVKAFAREADEHARFIGSVAAAQDEVLGSVRAGTRLSGARTLWAHAGRVAVLAAGSILVAQGRIGTGTLVAFLGYVGGLYGPAQTLMGLYETARRTELGLSAIFGVIDAEDAVPDPPAARELPSLRGEIELERVSFRYTTATRNALDQVSLRIHAGEYVAVVGKSGAGKSTLADLVLRFHDPIAGVVRLDGVDLRDVRQRDLRERIGLVTQEAFLFDDTIEANLRYGSPHATIDEVRAAARAAQCEAFIERLPHGYATLLGPGGVQLSGGERQRIAIARTLLKDPRVVILDEPTSCLDVEGEIAVQAAIERLAAGRTTIMIAHRLSTTARADRVLVLDDGRIVEDGSPAELLARAESRYGAMMRLWQAAIPAPQPIAAS